MFASRRRSSVPAYRPTHSYSYPAYTYDASPASYESYAPLPLVEEPEETSPFDDDDDAEKKVRRYRRRHFKSKSTSHVDEKYPGQYAVAVYGQDEWT